MDGHRTQISAEEAKKAEPERGFVCKVCECRDSRVIRTFPGDNFKRRIRACRNCGAQRMTTEQ